MGTPMDQQKQALKEAMTRKVQEGLDEIMSRPLGNLDQMEESVGKLKAELGRETLERLIALKKTPKTKD
jgi:hypothetical protein